MGLYTSSLGWRQAGCLIVSSRFWKSCKEIVRLTNQILYYAKYYEKFVFLGKFTTFSIFGIEVLVTKAVSVLTDSIVICTSITRQTRVAKLAFTNWKHKVFVISILLSMMRKQNEKGLKWWEAYHTVHSPQIIQLYSCRCCWYIRCFHLCKTRQQNMVFPGLCVVLVGM